MRWQPLSCAYEPRSFPQQAVEQGHAHAETSPVQPPVQVHPFTRCRVPLRHHLRDAVVSGSIHLGGGVVLCSNPGLVPSTWDCWDLWGDPTRHLTGVAPTCPRKEGHQQRFSVWWITEAQKLRSTALPQKANERARDAHDGAGLW